LYTLLPFSPEYVPYTAGHVVGQLELLLFSGLAFFVMLPMLRRTLTITLDVDWFYRKFAVRLSAGGEMVLTQAGRVLGNWLALAGPAVRNGLRRHHGMDGLLARTWTTGGMVLSVALMLAAYLIVYYL